MLIVKNVEGKKRSWTITKVDSEGNFEKILLRLDFKPASITNKYGMVATMIEDMCDKLPDFSDWFSSFIEDYVTDSYNSELLLERIHEFAEVSERYIDTLDIDFSSFTNTKKATKTSIIFDESDTKSIAVAATCLKLYSMFQYDLKLKPTDNIHRQIFEKILRPCIDNGTPTKIFQLIRSRIYRSSITDKYMWDLIKMAISETPESYIMNVFNFVMTNMISTLSPQRNPVPYVVSLVDDSIRWLMKNVYKNRILYGEVFGGSEDIYGSSISKESFYVYCCNDIVGKAAKAGMSLLENEYVKDGAQFDDARDRIDIVDMLTPPMKLLILPIASKVLEVPYKYLLTCPPKHVLLIGVFLHYISKGILSKDYPIIHEFLISYPNELKFSSTRSAYKIRNIQFIINNATPVFGFAVKTLKWEIMNSICGVLSASKKSLVSVVNGKQLNKITYYDLEQDVINFFTDLYSNGYEKKFEKMKELADAYF